MSEESNTEELTQGFRWEGADQQELAGIIDAAFDYRGNVTLSLSSGEELEGYIGNRDSKADSPFLDLFPKDGSSRRRLQYSLISGIFFSGKDTASGKSWETWLAKWNAKKEAEARGEKVGDISLFPDEVE